MTAAASETAGQPLERGARRAGQADGLQQDLRVERVRVEFRQQRQVLGRGHGGRDAAVLEHDPDPGPQLAAVRGRVETEDPDGPAVGPAVALADLDGGGFAGPVRAEEGGHLAASRGQRQAIDGGQVAVALDHGADLNGGDVTHARSLRSAAGDRDPGTTMCSS
jgi:hypothetical protein